MSPLRRRTRVLIAGVLAGLILGPVPGLAGPGVLAGSAAPQALAAPAKPAPPGVPIESAVRAQLASRAATDFWVVLKDRAELSAAATIADWNARGRAVVDALRATADRSQRGLVDDLRRRKARFTPYWAVNAVLVRGGTETDLDALASRTDVAEITAPRRYDLPEPAPRAAASAAGVEWGVGDIGADRVWSEFADRGADIVVGNIDSGVKFDHPALVGSYRGNAGGGTFTHDYNWFDASGSCANPGLPCAANYHGTHTMGTMVGDGGADNRIGVAPGARWIAAKACSSGCPDTALVAAGQWMLAPTRIGGADPDPGRRPHVVNNSWGAAGDRDPFYRDIVRAWRAAGMFPVFSAGNDGPACGTTGSPGGYPESFGVGAHASDGVVAPFSSRGPSATPGGGVKPEVTAPGVDVRSASTSAAPYAVASGTSMAAPHVAGAIALVWSATPALRGMVDETSSIIEETARQGAAEDCGGEPADNNTYGHGRLDAYAAVDAARRGGFGIVTGTVTDAAGDPVPDAEVRAGARTVRTASNGTYRTGLTTGTHELTVWSYGSTAVTRSVTVRPGQTITLDVTLPTAELTTVSGLVRDREHGWPLYAKVAVSPHPGGEPVFTDPLTGRWSVRLPNSGRFTVRVAPVLAGYAPVERAVSLPDATAVDTEPPLDGCTAPGYGGSPCAPLPGGLLVGTVTGTGSPGGVVGATVARPGDRSATATTVATPDDAGIGDGFYTLFAPAGRHAFEATKKDYRAVAGTATVVANAATRLDLTMKAAVLTIQPDTLGAEVPIGGQAERQVTVTNRGDVTTSFRVAERGYLNDSDPIPHSSAASTVTSARLTAAARAALIGARSGRVGTVAGQRRASGTAAADGAWTDAPSLPGALEDATAVSLDSTVYSIGGWSMVTGGADVPSVRALDPATGAWTPKRSMNSARQRPAAAVIDGRIYVTGGWHAWASDGLEIAEGLEIYNPADDTWAFQPGPPVGLAAAAGVALDGQFYVIGGCDWVRCDHDNVYRYDPRARAWHTVAPYPHKVARHSCGAIDGTIVCAGGVDHDEDFRDTYAYDPRTNAWTARAPMPVSRWGAAHAVSNGRLLVSGGVVDGAVTDSGHAYDAAADEWTALPPSGLPTVRAASACGLYQFGGVGWDGTQLAPTARGRLLPGHDACGPVADLPWLSASDRRYTLRPGESARVPVRFDAAAVSAPGVVRGALTIAESTPGTATRVRITLTVRPSPRYGRIEGTLTGEGRCGTGIGPLTGATVTVGGRRHDHRVRTDASGTFTVWADPDAGPVRVVADRPGMAVAPATVRPRAGRATPVALTGRRLAACATVQPGTVALTVRQGERGSALLTAGNDGLRGYRARFVESASVLGPLAAGRADVVAAGVRPRVEAPRRDLPGPRPVGWRTATEYPGVTGTTWGRGVTCEATPGIVYTFEAQRGFRYDASTDTWSETRSRPQNTEIQFGTPVCDVHTIHFFGGFSLADHSPRHLTYDVITDTWSTEVMLTPETIDWRYPGAAGAFDGKIYFVNGLRSGVAPSGAVYRYDPRTDTWSGRLSTAPLALTQVAYAQAGRYLYLAGGWNKSGNTPVNVVLRLDMATGEWTRGPDLPVATAFAALVSTDTALYYLGGSDTLLPDPLRKTGTAGAYRLPLAGFGTGSWTAIDGLPKASTGQATGCTEAVLGGEVWNITGYDEQRRSHRTNAFRGTPGETCEVFSSDVPWLRLGTAEATVDPGERQRVRVSVDATGLSAGTHRATVLVRTDDPGAPQVRIPVELTVTARGATTG